MSRAPDFNQDVRHALRLVSLGFDREASRVLADHPDNPAASVAAKALEGMSPFDARAALEAMPPAI